MRRISNLNNHITVVSSQCLLIVHIWCFNFCNNLDLKRVEKDMKTLNNTINEYIHPSVFEYLLLVTNSNLVCINLNSQLSDGRRVDNLLAQTQIALQT